MVLLRGIKDMESINKFEIMVAGWLKPLPHLPTNARKWIADNVWWMALTIINLSIIGILAMISFIFTVISLVNATSIYYSYSGASAYNGWSILAIIALLAIFAVNIILYAMSIMPLQLLQKRGWKYLFWALILQTVSVLISAILFGTVAGLIIGAIVIVICTYLLYEARSNFIVSHKN
jgi:hypothetical protein